MRRLDDPSSHKRAARHLPLAHHGAGIQASGCDRRDRAGRVVPDGAGAAFAPPAPMIQTSEPPIATGPIDLIIGPVTLRAL